MHGATEAEEQPPAGWVALVGAGPGDEGLLTVRAAELLRQAGLVVAGADLEPVARRYMSQDAQLTDPADGAGSARTLVQTARNGQLAVRLFNGDPLLSGAIGDAEACAKAGVRFEIVPGVPAATAVPAYAGIPLASERNGEVRIIHAAEASQLAYSPATLVVLGADAAPADLGKMLIAAGWPEGDPARHHLGRHDQRAADGGLHPRPRRARPEGGRGVPGQHQGLGHRRGR